MIHSFAGEFNYEITDANPGIVRGYVFTVTPPAQGYMFWNLL